MSNGWTPQRKARQAQLIYQWRPWELATGPRSVEGKTRVSRNAFKGGHRPAHRETIANFRSFCRANEDLLNCCMSVRRLAEVLD
jgi:hypothetical protein